jgi:hypothetical protein
MPQEDTPTPTPGNESANPAPGQANSGSEAGGASSSGASPKSPGTQGVIAGQQISGFQKLLMKSVEIPRTMLDMDACKGVVNRLLSDKEAKLKEQLSQPSSESFKPLVTIDKYKKGSPCPMKWDEFTGTERIRYCERCQLYIYNFDKVELPQAQEMVFKREEKKNCTFFKRPDGKFMTVNCPEGLKRKRGVIIATAVACIALILMLFAASQAPPPKPESAQGDQNGGATSSTNTAGGTPDYKAMGTVQGATAQGQPDDGPVVTITPDSQIMARPIQTGVVPAVAPNAYPANQYYGQQPVQPPPAAPSNEADIEVSPGNPEAAKMSAPDYTAPQGDASSATANPAGTQATEPPAGNGVQYYGSPK